MSYEFGDNPSSWLDAALRDVPLPPDLIARLRQLGVDDDRELDRVLQRVSVPQELFQRLRQIPIDLELDSRIRRIAVGDDLLSRLKEIPDESSSLVTAAMSGTEPTSDFNSDSVPKAVAATLPQRRSAAQRDRFKAAMWIAAASVAALVALGVWRFEPDRGTPTRVDPHPSPPIVLDTLIEDGERARFAEAAIEFDSDKAPDNLAAMSPELLARAMNAPSNLIGESTSVADEASRIASKWWMDASVYLSQQYTMPMRERENRSLFSVGRDQAEGWSPPAARGFDWSALLRDGVNPFVSPADDPRLRSVRIPLDTITASYHDYLLGLSEQVLISPHDVRTEEFLAAVDYRFPMPQEEALTLYASGGPSPWDPLHRKLLLLGVQARAGPSAPRDPVELTLVVDASLACPGVNAFAACREAFRQVAETLQVGDRLSILLAAQRPIPLAQRLGVEDDRALAAAIGQIGPQQIVDVVPAIEAAVSQAGRTAGAAQAVVVCVTSDLEHLVRSERQRLGGLVAAAAERGVRFEVVRLGATGGPDAVSTGLANSGGGEVYTASAAADLWPILYRLLTTRSAVAADRVALSIEFDPQIVESYRILGHEAQLVRHPENENDQDVRAAQLLVGQSSVAMFELTLKEFANGDVGAARLEWRDPVSGETTQASQRVSTAQFATTIAEAALPLQRATIAAMTAEILREHRYVPPNATLDDVVRLADTLDGRLWEEPAFVELVDSIEAAHALRRPNGNRGLILFKR